MRLSYIVAAGLLQFASAQSSAGGSSGQTTKGYQAPSQIPTPGSQTTVGCFSSSGNLTDPGGYADTSVSSGFCGVSLCVEKGFTVFAIRGPKCYCGNTYPPEDDIVEDSRCNYPCPAYPAEACGGISSGGAWSVFNSGIEVDVEYDTSSSSTTSAAATSTAAATPAGGNAATSATAPATTTSSDGKGNDNDKKSSNVGPIVGGLVGGIFGLAAVAGGVFLYMRRRRNREIEEEHRRNAAVNAFINGKSSPGGSMSISDSRLDPVMAQRRMSDGSIADNEDYSRRILRVTNA
ncbi:Protein SLG1 [Ceratocystis pirilliformis]|uniref:Protein SLG1 n=1 Tax=Ceratocystis pirilliformis TaxID=259994 RepID=A0ABR3Z245_9PEZI